MPKIIFTLIITMFLSCKGAHPEIAQEKESQLELKNTTTKPEPQIIYNTDSTTVKFKGVVTNTINDCWADGFCSIEVNHKWWIIIIDGGLKEPGVEPEIRGDVIGISFSQNNESIGKKIAVYAKTKGNRDQNKLTLKGSKTYYVKTIE